jgi:hypothetical protein
MRPSAPLPPLLLAMAALSLGCSTTIQGGQGGDEADAEPLELPDGAPTLLSDAAPQAVPCVEGDQRVENPDDGTCYMLFNGLLNRQDAQAQCIGVGANLVAIETLAEQTIVGNLAAGFPAGQPDLWLGASDVVTENSFLWADGSPVVFDNWRDGEPNDNGPGDAGEDCSVIEGDNPAKEWDDRTCLATFPSICERAP